MCIFFTVAVAPEMVEDSSLLLQRSAHTHENDYRSMFDHEKPLIHSSFTLNEKPLIANLRDSSYGTGNRRVVTPTPTDLDFMHSAFKPTHTIEFNRQSLTDGLSDENHSETSVTDSDLHMIDTHNSEATAPDALPADLYQRKVDILFDIWNQDVTELRRNLINKGEGWQEIYDNDAPIFISDLTRTFYLEHDDATKLADATLQYVEKALKDKVPDAQIMANIKEMYSIMFGVTNIPADSSHLQDIFEVMKEPFIEALPGIIKADIREIEFKDLLRDIEINSSEREQMNQAQNIKDFADVVHRVVMRNFVDSIVVKVLSPLWDKQGVSSELAEQLNNALKEQLLQSSSIEGVDAQMKALYPYLDLQVIDSLQVPDKLQVTSDVAEALKQYGLHMWNKLVEKKIASLDISENEASMLRQKLQEKIDTEMNEDMDSQEVFRVIQSSLREVNELNEDSVQTFEASLPTSLPEAKAVMLSIVPTVLQHVSSEIAKLQRTETSLTISPSESVTVTERAENIEQAKKALTLIEHLQKTLEHINPFTAQQEHVLSAQQRALNLLAVGLKVAAVSGAVYGLYSGHLTGEISKSGGLGIVYTH